MKELNCLIFLSCVSVLTVTGQSDVTGSHEPVHVTVGQDVILPCHLEPPYDVTDRTVEWKRNKDIVHVYRNKKDDPGLQDENFRGRTSLFLDELIRGNISLKLTNVTEQDEGNYTCFVPKLDSQVRRGFIHLIVGQLFVIGSLQPIVAAPGDDVILPCHVEPQYNVERLTVEWSKPDMKPDPSDRLSRVDYVHLYRDRRPVSDMQIPSYAGRTELFTDDLKRGNISLKIKSVTLEDGGRFRCFIPKLNSWSMILLVVDPNFVKTSATETPLHLNTHQTPDTRSRSHQAVVIPAVVLSVFVILGCVAGFLHKHKCPKQNLLKNEASTNTLSHV